MSASAPMHEAIAAALDSLDELIRPGRVLLIGEWNGTNEFPALVSAIVDHALAKGVATVVGLEVPMSEDLSKGTGETVGAFWHRASEFQDGRSSRAMANLVDRLAGVARESRDLHVVALDGPWVAPGSEVPLHLLDHLERAPDETMAMNLMATLDSAPQAFTVVLASSMHTRVTRRPQAEISGSDSAESPATAGAPPARTLGAATLGSVLRAWYPTTISLLSRSSGGQAWMLHTDGTAGPGPVPDDSALEPGAQWSAEAGADGHHGYIHLGSVTASPPAYLN